MLAGGLFRGWPVESAPGSDIASPGVLPNHLSIRSVREGGRTCARCERLAGFLLALAFAANESPAAPAPCAQTDARKPNVILETDFTLDVDDVGALAVLHALADRGEANILAVSYNEAQRNAAAAIRSVNAWYGRADLPVGVFRGPLAAPDDEHSRYIDRLAQMAPRDGDAAAESSHAMYRRVLRAQPDGSVTIVSVGFLNNLHDLLRSDGELVRAKVRKLVLMGGVRNDGFNFVRHNLAGQTQHVLTHWPTPIVVSQEGADIRTGAGLRDAPAENPVREAYRLWWRGEVKSRSSWDQLAVLYGVRGGACFEEVATGEGRLRSGFTWRMQPGWRTYLRLRVDKRELQATIEALMVAEPVAR